MDFKQIRFTEIAKLELEETLDYIQKELLNPKAAKRLLAKVFNTIERISLLPESYPCIENDFVLRKDIRKAVVGKYLLYYHYDSVEKIITILRFVYAKSSHDSLLKQI